ncbi:ParB N-terminal domain-containing protein [Mesorhizobium sp. B263B2A]|nr:ParB N-terminal domain-containing protein [Mesorhizobium sp. B263B2A]
MTGKRFAVFVGRALGPPGQTDYLSSDGGVFPLRGIGMLRVQKVKVEDIYVPTARKKTLHPETVRHLAEDILENGMKTPIQVRHDGKRHILVEGLHRLEAAKWLGETEIDAYLVQAKRH